jgi:para-nitrobenzyl esterase
MTGIVEIQTGRIRGVERRGGVWSFSGVPYAAPPTGPLRWQPPLAHAPWGGVRQCDRFGASAPQPPSIPGMSLGGEPGERSEDCLSLSVWTPGIDDGRRAVMVWIHGGGFTSGSGSGDLYRGGTLAGEGDVVVVTINYRLGALGFLAHPALAGSGEPWMGGDAWTGWGNWGLADQVAALVWVRDNIAAFGGDPGNVTIFGESAGGMSVSALLAVPEAKGLFHRAVVESGPPYTHSAEVGADRAEQLASLLGVPTTRQALEQVDPDDLVRVVGEIGASLRIGDAGIPLAMLPTVDGGLLASRPEEAIAAGSVSDVPLLVGTTRDEAAFFALGIPDLGNLDDERLGRWVQRAGPDADQAAAIVTSYRQARSGRGEPVSPRDLWVAIATDSTFRLPSVRLADAHAAAADSGVGTFTYLFTWETPAFGGQLGSCHALEIPFVFGTVMHPSVQLFSGGGDAALELSEGMRQAWMAFARAGSPSNHRSGEWPAWNPSDRPTMVFGPWPGSDGMWRAVDGPRDAELVALGGALVQQSE